MTNDAKDLWRVLERVFKQTNSAGQARYSEDEVDAAIFLLYMSGGESPKDSARLEGRAKRAVTKYRAKIGLSHDTGPFLTRLALLTYFTQHPLPASLRNNIKTAVSEFRRSRQASNLGSCRKVLGEASARVTRAPQSAVGLTALALRAQR